jgi:N-acetylneuraminic acid mutarotase
VIKEAYRIEQASGKNIVNAVAKNIETLDLFIFSSLSAARKLSNDRYQTIYHFDAKAETVEYLEADHPELVEKTVALQLGMFATNIFVPTPMRPTKVSEARWLGSLLTN